MKKGDFGGLETLPPNPKFKCPECGRLINQKRIEANIRTGKFVCPRCNKKLGSNKYYNPNWKSSNYISRYTMSDEEKKVLHDEYVKRGNSSEQAWKKVNQKLKALLTIKYMQKKQFIQKKQIEKQQIQNRKETNQKFLEGLFNAD